MKSIKMNKYKTIKDEKKGKQVFKFLIPSLLGILLFMCPIRVGGKISIPIAVLSDYIQQRLFNILPQFALLLVFVSAVGSLCSVIVHRLPRMNQYSYITESSYFSSLFPNKVPTFLLRLAALIAGILVYFQFGHEMIYSLNTGGLVFYNLLPVLCTVFLLAGFLLPLLLNYGLLEFTGTLLTKVMWPVFRLPGRAAIDAIASWLGDGTIGVLLTSKQYEEGLYTKKEACVIGTSFSLVSITFCLVVINTVGLSHMFLPFYLTVSVACLIAAIILPKIPPLSKKSDCLVDGTKRQKKEQTQGEQLPVLKNAYHIALEKVKGKNVIQEVLSEGTANVMSMWIGVIPIVMITGTIALVIAEYTPVFKILGLVFLPLLNLLGVPEAAQASQTMIAGFADMLLPSVMIAGVENEMTRFIVAAVSVSQLIYLSEIGALLLASSIPIRLKELFIIFMERTLITLPIITIIAKVIL